jgi:hypothetical protein
MLGRRDSCPLAVAASYRGVPEGVEPGNKPPQRGGCWRGVGTHAAGRDRRLGGAPEDVDPIHRPREAKDVGGVSGTTFGTTSSARHRKAVESKCRNPVPSGLPATRHSIPTTCRLRFRQQAAGGKKAGNLRFASTCQRTTLELVAKTHQDPPEAYRRFERPAGKA